MAVDWVGYGYAALTATGGIIGFVKAGSVTSLVAGLVCGLLAAIGAYHISQNSKNIWVSLGTSGTLAVVMGLRFLNSGKLMPAGLMAGLRLGCFILKDFTAEISFLMFTKILIAFLRKTHKT